MSTRHQMSKRRFITAWDAIEDSPGAAEIMKVRSALMMALKDHIERNALSQSKAAEILGVTQPRVSDLVRGKIDLFSIDALVNMLSEAGLQVKVRIVKAA